MDFQTTRYFHRRLTLDVQLLSLGHAWRNGQRATSIGLAPKHFQLAQQQTNRCRAELKTL
jgi:hypothetical protein